MTPHEFCTRWAARLDPAERDQFLLEVAILLTNEQALERRRILGSATWTPEDAVTSRREEDVKEALQRA